MARASVSDGPGMRSSGGVPGMSHRKETPRKTQDTLERLCRPAELGTPWDPPGRAGVSVRGEGSLAAPATRPRTIMDGWMDIQNQTLNAIRKYSI